MSVHAHHIVITCTSSDGKKKKKKKTFENGRFKPRILFDSITTYPQSPPFLVTESDR